MFLHVVIVTVLIEKLVKMRLTRMITEDRNIFDVFDD